MADRDEEEYEVPSGGGKRKEIELSRGVVIMPPERFKKIEEEAKKEEETAQEAPAKPSVREERRPLARPVSGTGGLGPSMASVLAVIAIILALAAIGFSYLTLNSYNQMRTEIRGVVADLNEFKKSNFTINAELTAEHSVREDIAIKDILSPVSIPVSKVLEVEGIISVYNPATKQYDYQPYAGNLTVRGAIDIDPTTLDPNRKMRLNYTIPGTGSMILGIPVSGIWTSDLDDVISRLEKIAK